MRGSDASGFVILLAFWLIGVLALAMLWPSTRPGRIPAISVDATLAAQDGPAGSPSGQR